MVEGQNIGIMRLRGHGLWEDKRWVDFPKGEYLDYLRSESIDTVVRKQPASHPTKEV